MLLCTTVYLNNMFFFAFIMGKTEAFWKILIFGLLVIPPATVSELHSLTITPLYMFLFSYLTQKNLPFIKHLYYGFYVATTTDLSLQIIGYVIIPTLFNHSNQANLLHNSPNWLSYIMVIPFCLIFHYLLHIDYTAIRKTNDKAASKLFSQLTINMIIFYFLVQSSLFIQANFPQINYISTRLRYDILFFYLILFTWNLHHLNKVSIETVYQKIYEERKNYFHHLLDYNYYLESLYRELGQFKNHLSHSLDKLEESIESHDINQINQDFEKLFPRENNPFKNNKYSLDRLVNIKVATVKSFLAAKLFEARKEGIKVDIEIPDIISDIPLKILDFIVILSVFCDNAIEAAKESQEKRLSIALFYLEEQLVLIIENSTLEKQISISHIFEENYSTKKGVNQARGIGLTNVKKILDQYPYFILSTKSDSYLLKQHLRMPIK
ncbi:GHKL domain-containing protein [Streptococcus didelphis]|nr:GHKL domain-containing protein [Streptococcus didelphis]WMB29791.1 GHKL domain-containing protein [Streptococcus didelphis]